MPWRRYPIAIVSLWLLTETAPSPSRAAAETRAGPRRADGAPNQQKDSDVEMKAPFIHPNAIVETYDIGDGTRVWAFAHILAGARVGRDCNICDHTFI